jgi:hypothetical protein
MVGNPFLYYAGIQSTQHPQSSRVSLPVDDIFYPRVEIFLLVDGWKSFLYYAGIQSTQHPQSSRVSLPLIFSTLRVEIFLLVDGWKSFSLLRRDTVYAASLVESSQSASWMIFFHP